MRAVTEAPPSKAARRVRRLAVAAVALGLVAVIRRVLLDRDQRTFDARYGPSPDGSAPS